MLAVYCIVAQSFSPSISIGGYYEQTSALMFSSPQKQCRPGSTNTHLSMMTPRKETGATLESIQSSLFSSPSSISSLDFLDEWYTRSAGIKCPFFRRRAADMIDSISMVGNFLLIRHKTLVPYTPPGCRAGLKVQQAAQAKKNTGLDQDMLYNIVRQDWRPDTLKSRHKGYYVTGHLNATIYRDDCLFDGPDPDMPVRGVRKFVNSISQLFEKRQTTSKLVSLEWAEEGSKLVAHWELEGALMLPWHPRIPSFSGSISYHFDDDGLIFFHEEDWDITVAEAFVSTVWPTLSERIWKRTPI